MGQIIRLKNDIERELIKIDTDPNKAIRQLLNQSGCFMTFPELEKKVKDHEKRLIDIEDTINKATAY